MLGGLGVGFELPNKGGGFEGTWAPGALDDEVRIEGDGHRNAATATGEEVVHELGVLIAEEAAQGDAASARGGNGIEDREDLGAIPAPVLIQDQPMGALGGRLSGCDGLGGKDEGLGNAPNALAIDVDVLVIGSAGVGLNGREVRPPVCHGKGRRPKIGEAFGGQRRQGMQGGAGVHGTKVVGAGGIFGTMKTRKFGMKAGLGLALIVAFMSQTTDSQAQESPITLVTQTSTTHYTDGSSRSRSTMLFEVEGERGQQPLGFMGRRLKEHLNPNPAVQQKFKSYRTMYVASASLAVAFTGTLLATVFNDEEAPADVQANGTVAEIWWGYKWPIITGVGYLATGIVAGKALVASVELHNGLVSDGGGGDFGLMPGATLDAGLLQANSTSSGGLGFRLTF